MNNVCFITPASDNREDEYQKMYASFKKFHPNIPMFRWNQKKINSYKDQNFFYRATPIMAKEMLEKYDTVIKIDTDSIVTGDLSQLWQGDFDVAVVNNSNPREHESYPYTLWDIHPLAYVNCGLVVMKSKAFVNQWLKLCFTGHFNNYQMREQDLLNIMVAYGDYKIKRMDEGDSFYGLASKGYWPDIKLVNNQLLLEKGAQWPDKDKFIKVIHFAGGNVPNKFNLHTKFQPDVVKYLEGLIK